MGQIENDNYPTPQKLADAVIREQVDNGVRPAVFIEPSCGEGRFIRAARAAWPDARIIGVDIIGEYRRAALEAGANVFVQNPWEAVAESILEQEQDAGGKVLVLGNPPFSLAQRHIEVTLRNLVQGNLLSYLLRLSFFGSKGRALGFWPEHRPMLHCITPITPRPSYRVFKNVSVPVPGEFDENGEQKYVVRRRKVSTTDNSEYAMYHFMKRGPLYEMAMPPFINLPMVWKDEERAVRGRAA